MKTFEQAVTDWKHNGDCEYWGICECEFDWNCPACGAPVVAIGEEMPDYVEHEGKCQTCVAAALLAI